MIRKKITDTGSIKRIDLTIGETIETKVDRITRNREPITDGAPVLYTKRSDGVKPETDIRTDRWDVALDAMDKVSKTYIAQREERIKQQSDLEKIAKGENTDGTSSENAK